MTVGSYPSRRPSGIPWIDEVPEHWGVRRIKTLFREIDRRNGNQNRELLSLTRRSGLIPHREATTKLASAVDHTKYKVCEPGNLVMNRMQAWSGMFALATMEGIVSPDYAVFEPIDNCDLRFYEYVFKTREMVGQFARHSKGIGTGFNRLYTESFGSIFAVAPPLAEQRAIARYLDYMDRRIQRYIRAKERLIELLEEQKRAVINRAVTRGLDPDVPLKPSGVEWLGDVPAHWEVRRLRSLASITTGGKDTVDRRDDGKYPFFVRSQKVERIDTWSFDGEAVLTAGDGVGVGRVFHYIDGKFDFHQRVYKFSEFKAVNGKFFFHFIRSTLHHVVSQGTAKSTVDSIRLPMLQNLLVAFPKLPEQSVIVEYVDDHINRSEVAVERANKQIELIKEYRTRLIADVVTGKLDAREAAANLPDGVEEDELSDRSYDPNRLELAEVR